MIKEKLPVVLAIVAILISAWSIVNASMKSAKTGYIILGKVLQDFEMKKEKERELQNVGLQRKKYLDSLKFKIDNFYADPRLTNEKGKLDSLRMLYDARANEFNQLGQSMVEKYNADVMERLTKLSKEFAEEYNYDIILGAEGSGVLMYANENMDVTKDFTEYINQNYKEN